MTPNSTSGVQTSALTNSLVSTQSNQSPNPCALSATNGLVNQSAVTSSLNPLLGVYEAGLSKEQLQQLQMEISKQNQQQFLNLKNGNSAASFLEQQHSSTPVSFNNSNNSSATGLAHPTQTPPPNGTSTNAQSTERSEKEQFYLQGIDPADTTNRYFNQYTEVCPCCQRRFKSIKWMKTHVLNEHQNLINSQSPLSNKSSSNKPNESSDKIRCIFCTKLFSDNIVLHTHLVNDHRSSLEEMIFNRNMASNFGKFFVF